MSTPEFWLVALFQKPVFPEKVPVFEPAGTWVTVARATVVVTPAVPRERVPAWNDLLAKPERLKGPKGLDSGPKKPYETLLPSLSVKPTSISVRIKSMTSPVDGV